MASVQILAFSIEVGSFPIEILNGKVAISAKISMQVATSCSIFNSFSSIASTDSKVEFFETDVFKCQHTSMFAIYVSMAFFC